MHHVLVVHGNVVNNRNSVDLMHRSRLMMYWHEELLGSFVFLLALVADDALGRHGVVDLGCGMDFVDWSYVDGLNWDSL